MIKFGSPQLTAEDYLAVKDVLDSGQLTKGPKNEEFESVWEEEVLKGEGYATCTSSCMGSLHLGALIEDLGEGDEVICPAMSFVATANAIEITGATPVFVDCTLETGNMDICSIEDSITKKTKAIFVVHFAGIPLDMNSVMDIAGRHDLFVVEDCALAPGATIFDLNRGVYRSVGLWGDIGCFSFHPVKHITTGEGGMLVSHYESNVLQANIIKSFGTRLSTSWPMSSPPMYDAPFLGLNYRMSEINAALGIGQTRRLSDTLKTREQNFKVLKGLLTSLDLSILDSSDPDLKSAHYCLVALVGLERDTIRENLLKVGIETSVYYPHSIPSISYYQEKYGYCFMRNAEHIAKYSVAFPVGQHLNEEDMVTMARAMKGLVL